MFFFFFHDSTFSGDQMLDEKVTKKNLVSNLSLKTQSSDPRESSFMVHALVLLFRFISRWAGGASPAAHVQLASFQQITNRCWI